MADGFIVRRGGKAEEVLRTSTPDINFVSKTQTEIVVTFKNNDAGEAEIYYGLTAPLTDTVTLATGATSSNITFSGLAANTQFTVSAYALVTDPTTKKIKSEIVSTNITTDAPVYTAATGGDIEEYDDGGKRYKSHTFTEDDDFIVTTVGDATGDRNKADFLVIAGGGGGGTRTTSGGSRAAGGGGAGGYQTSLGTSGAESSALSKITLTATTYSIDVGAGGDGSTTTTAQPSNGSNSKFSTITSVGGGYGSAQDNIGGVYPNGASGGSGGGAYHNGTGGAGTSNQGRNGGNGTPGIVNVSIAGGGGGGAKDAGVNGASNKGGNGGDGLPNILRTGSAETRAGGGGGNSAGGAGLGGAGGGGDSGGASGAGQNGAANTGGGGGAGSAAVNGGNGGSGIVVIRYEIAPSV